MCNSNTGKDLKEIFEEILKNEKINNVDVWQVGNTYSFIGSSSPGYSCIIGKILVDGNNIIEVQDYLMGYMGLMNLICEKFKERF